MNYAQQGLRVITWLALGLASASATPQQSGNQRSAPGSVVLQARQRMDPADVLPADIVSSISDASATGTRTAAPTTLFTVKLTLGNLPDSHRLTRLCATGGQPLRAVAKRVVALSFPSTLIKASCTASEPIVLTLQLRTVNRDTDPYVDPILASPVFSTAHEAMLEPEHVGPSTRDPSIYAPPTRPIFFDAPHQQVSTYTLTVPPNLTIAQLPPRLDLDGPYGSLHRVYLFADGQIQIKQTFVIKEDRVETADEGAYWQWNENNSSQFRSPQIGPLTASSGK